jgi:hypothetical protein
MKLIAHRGLFNGPDKNLENTPSQIELALAHGFDCEIDFWIVDDKFYLGHDGPQYLVNQHFIENNNFWIHAKNLNALQYLLGTTLNYFWHQTDNYTLTSNKYIWAYPGQPLTHDSVMVMPEWDDPTLSNVRHSKCFAVCSDFVGLLK